MAEAENVGMIDMFHPWLEFCLEKTSKLHNNDLHCESRTENRQNYLYFALDKLFKRMYYRKHKYANA